MFVPSFLSPRRTNRSATSRTTKRLRFESLENRRLLSGTSVAVTVTADQSTIVGGATAGFTVKIANNTAGVAAGLTLNDPLPAGAGNDITWTIDNSTGNPADFTISNQTLVLSPSFIAAGASLGANQSISVHVIGGTSLSDAAGSANPALGIAAQYAALFDSNGHQLSITNNVVNGNIGVVGNGTVAFSGPGAIYGHVDFSAANTGQFKSTNKSNVGPTSGITYNNPTPAAALAVVDSLSATLATLPGTPLSIGNGNQTVNESAGQRDVFVFNGVTYAYKVFTVTSYAMTSGHSLTIFGDGSGDPIVFNLKLNKNYNINGGVNLAGPGLHDDLIVWNFADSGQNVNMSANNGDFIGVMLLPNDAFSGSSVHIDGRIYGGRAGNMQIVSGTNLSVPAAMGTVTNTAFLTWNNQKLSYTAYITITSM